MRVAGLTWLAAALAVGMLAGPAPGAAQDQPGAQSPADAAPDQDSQAPPAEPRIDAAFGHAWLGAADGDVTLVVFADYACPACRTAQAVIDQLLAQDPKLKVVYRLLDNDQGGRTAALTSLAVAAQPGADWAKFHHALDAATDVTPTTIAAALAASGADRAALPPLGSEDDPATAALADELRRNDSLISQRQGTALPSWVIGNDPAQRGFDLARLQAAVAKARGVVGAGGT